MQTSKRNNSPVGDHLRQSSDSNPRPCDSGQGSEPLDQTANTPYPLADITPSSPCHATPAPMVSPSTVILCNRSAPPVAATAAVLFL